MTNKFVSKKKVNALKNLKVAYQEFKVSPPQQKQEKLGLLNDHCSYINSISDDTLEHKVLRTFIDGCEEIANDT